MVLASRLQRPSQARRWGERIALVSAGAAVAAAASYLNRRRRHVARDRAVSLLRRSGAQANRTAHYAVGAAHGVAYRASAPLRRDHREYDDATLADKVKSELFRPVDAPKGAVSVNVQDGIVELRGELKHPEDVKRLAEAASRIDGVRDVHNLMHTPGSPARHSPPSDPNTVRERAEAAKSRSRFAGNPATARPADEPMLGRAPDPPRPHR